MAKVKHNPNGISISWNSSSGKYSIRVPDGKYGHDVMEFDPPSFHPDRSLEQQMVAKYNRKAGKNIQVTATL